MRVAHVAVWTADLERLRAFYERHLGATSGRKYENAAKGFSSYFIDFDGGARLELMSKGGIAPAPAAPAPERAGYAHLALSLGSRDAVVALTDRLHAAGIPVLDGPRTTGDGYFESVVADPDGNRIELTE
ncbi:MAG TPA: VOC family protein [Polyangia bacterium]|jgi:lactoylglutathione lyase